MAELLEGSAPPLGYVIRARPFLDGAPLAIRKVSTLGGVQCGLDSVLGL